MDQSNDGLLAGVKVLEFGEFFAGPTASRMMTDMGAEVVKVEFGPHGDHLRGYTPLKAGQSAIFMLKTAARRASASTSKRTRASASRGNWPPRPTC